MCKFTYLGYAGCDEPERHYLIRREKCSAKAHLKHWCAPNEQQEEPASTDDESRLNLECPMCADVPIIYDQPLLEIAHSRRSVLPAPHYDGVSGKYSRLPRHHAQYNSHNNNSSSNIHAANFALPVEPTASLVPMPLNPVRMHYDRSASETAVDRIKESEVSPDYQLPAATYTPAAAAQKDAARRPVPLPMPQPMELTPPSSREASLSPPQSRMGHAYMRAIPPGESSRRELESIRERQRAAVLAKTQNRPGVDRSRSGSESSSTSTSSSHTNNNTSVPPPPPPPRMPSRKPSTASSTTSSSTANTSPPSQASSSAGYGRPQHHRKDSTSTSASAFSSSSSSSSSASAILRTIGLDRDRTASPERGRRPHRRERGGSSSERSGSPSVWRPTISPPRLQQDSLGMGPGGPGAEIAGSFKQRLVPFAPSKSSNSSLSPRREAMEPPASRSRTPQQQQMSQGNDNDGDGASAARQATLLRLFPNRSDDEKVARAALDTMLHEEQKALYAAQVSSSSVSRPPTRAGGGATAVAVAAPGPKKTVNFAPTPAGGPRGKGQQQHPDEETLTEVDMQTVTQMARSGGDPYHLAGVGRRAPGGAGEEEKEEKGTMNNNNSSNKDKFLPSLPTNTTTTTSVGIMARPAAAALRRIRTGQVKTVTVAPPRPPKRANTADDSAALTSGNARAGVNATSTNNAPSGASARLLPEAGTSTSNTVRVKAPLPAGSQVHMAGGPLFRFAGVGGGSSRAQEFEIVSGVEASVGGRAF